MRTSKGIVSGAFAFLVAAAAQAATITLDAGTTYQTMNGWEAVAWASNDAAAFPNFIDEVLDRAVNELGIDRIRLEVRSGVENSEDYWSQYQQGLIDYATWRANRYANVNDDGNPNNINSSGFHFSELDWTVDNIVLPLKGVVEAGGGHLYINLNYVAFTGQITTGQYIHDDPDEYAEFVLATYLHLDGKYGWVPDAWEVLLEPDNVAQWNGTLLGQAMLAVAGRLEASGFTPGFIAPSNTNMGNAITYFDAMAAVLGASTVTQYVEELCYHRYGGVSISNLQAIASRGVTYGVGTSMLEWWSNGNTYHVLHEDLKVGCNSAFQQGVLAGVGAPDAGVGLYKVDDSDPGNPQVLMNNATKYVRQYFHFIRSGAVRIEAASDDGSFDPLAFVNAGGGHVVVIKAAGGGSLSVTGLPAGTYGVKYTTGTPNNAPTAYDVDHPDATLGAAQALDVEA